MKKPFLTLMFFLTKIAISAILVYIAYILPGKQETSLRFIDYVIDVKTGLLAASAIVIIILIHYIMRIGSWLSVLPGRVRAYLAQRRLEKSKENVLESFVAMAAGEFNLATTLSGRAQYLDPTNIFAPVFFAQASFMKGDYEEAERRFNELLRIPQTRFLGLRGLISLRQKQHRFMEVKGLLEDLLKDRPHSPWALNQLFAMMIQQGAFDKADELVGRLKTAQGLTAEKAARHRAILCWLKAKRALIQGDDEGAESLLIQTLKMDPTLSTATFALARLYVQQGKLSKAQKWLVKGYGAQPQGDYLEIIEELMGSGSSLERYQFAEDLTSPHPQSPETHAILASLAIKARLWGQARLHLNLLGEKHLSKSYFQLMADLEASELASGAHREESVGSPYNAPNYLADMLYAPPDPLWVCQECHCSLKTWEAICPSCNGFDTLILESITASEMGAGERNKGSEMMKYLRDS